MAPENILNDDPKLKLAMDWLMSLPEEKQLLFGKTILNLAKAQDVSYALAAVRLHEFVKQFDKSE